MKAFLNVAAASVAFVSVAVGFSAAPAVGETPDPAAAFPAGLAGDWSGRGDVRIRTDRSPLRVSCDVRIEASEAAFDLDGSCGALLISAPIAVRLSQDGGVYTGVYEGSRSGPAALEGAVDGDGVLLDVTWNAEINGDRAAVMSLEKVDENGFRLTTRDLDPETGEEVVTSDILLKRAE